LFFLSLNAIKPDFFPMEQPDSSSWKPVHRHHRRKHRLEDAHRPNLFRRLESIISKYLIKILGVVFILASLWYASSSADKLIGIVKTLGSQEKVWQQTDGLPAVPSPGNPVQVIETPGPGPMLIWTGILVLLSALLLWVSYRYHRREIPRILVIVFYAADLLMAIRLGWQIHVLFPVVLLFSVALYRTAIHLRSTLPFKANILLAWGLFGLWWLLKLVIPGNNSLAAGTYIYASLFFLLFFGCGIFKGLRGYHKSSYYTETGVVLINILAFYMMVSVTLIRTGQGDLLWIFSLVLALIIFALLYFTDRLKEHYNPLPCLISAMILLSLVLPLAFRIAVPVLFFGVLSLLLLVYARFSGKPPALVAAFGMLTVMLLFFLKEWLLVNLPAIFLGNLSGNNELIRSGLLSGLFVIPVYYSFHAMLKEMETNLPKKWFSRRVYLRMLKGLLLGAVYLAAFWIVNALLVNWYGNDDLKFQSWVSFSCLFFIIGIPILAKQKSSYLRPVLWFSLIITLAYPGLVHLHVLELRNTALQFPGGSWTGFRFHYAVVVLLVINILVTGVHFRQVLKDQPYLWQGIQVYFLLLVLFLLLSELDHFRLLTGLKKGINRDDLILTTRMLPYTLVMLTYSSLILLYGLLARSRFLRATALVLLALTFAKVLYMDIRFVDAAGRTALLFGFGGLMLAFSFFYPKIRKNFRKRGESGRRHRKQ
jgi:hypothetical protein